MVLGDTRHIKREERAHVTAIWNGDGGALVGGRTAGGRGQRDIGRGWRKDLTVEGDVQPYGWAYQGRAGVHTGTE